MIECSECCFHINKDERKKLKIEKIEKNNNNKKYISLIQKIYIHIYRKKSNFQFSNNVLYVLFVLYDYRKQYLTVPLEQEKYKYYLNLKCLESLDFQFTFIG